MHSSISAVNLTPVAADMVARTRRRACAGLRLQAASGRRLARGACMGDR